MKQRPILQTARLVLRPFELTDAQDVRRLAGERAIADTAFNIPHPYKDGMAEQWIATHQPEFEAGKQCVYAITSAETGELIGAVELVISLRFNRAELGYWVGTRYWNKGYCTEAAGAILEYGFSVLGLNRIHASHFTRNPASCRVLIKLGMTHEGHLREHAKRWDQYENIELYGVLAKEWIQR